MQSIIKKLFLLILCTGLFISFQALASAESTDASGWWRYTVENGNATITGYEQAPTGALQIPSQVDGYPVTAIGDEAFRECDGISSVTIPEGVTHIGDRAFRLCTALRSIALPDSLVYLGQGAFGRCFSLDSVEIPRGVAAMDMNPFLGCPVAQFSVAAGNTAFAAVDGVLFDAQLKTLVAYPVARPGAQYAVPEGTQTIGAGAFALCEQLTGIDLPQSVTRIDICAFEGCKTLSDITLPAGVISIGQQAFRSCESLTQMAVPDGVAAIGRSAFSGCAKLLSVALPSDLTDVGAYAFADCTNLVDITLPASVHTIGEGAFAGCEKLPWVEIPDGVTAVPAHAFSGCDGLLWASIPNSVTSIGERAFFNATNMYGLIIPEAVTNIGDLAISGGWRFRLYVTKGSAGEELGKTEFAAYYYTPEIPTAEMKERAIAEAWRKATAEVAGDATEQPGYTVDYTAVRNAKVENVYWNNGLKQWQCDAWVYCTACSMHADLHTLGEENMAFLQTCTRCKQNITFEVRAASNRPMQSAASNQPVQSAAATGSAAQAQPQAQPSFTPYTVFYASVSNALVERVYWDDNVSQWQCEARPKCSSCGKEGGIYYLGESGTKMNMTCTGCKKSITFEVKATRNTQWEEVTEENAPTYTVEYEAISNAVVVNVRWDSWVEQWKCQAKVKCDTCGKEGGTYYVGPHGMTLTTFCSKCNKGITFKVKATRTSLD